MNATIQNAQVGRYTIEQQVDEFNRATYAILDAHGDEVDFGFDLMADAVEAAGAMEAADWEEDRQLRLDDLRRSIGNLMAGCEDVARLQQVKTLLGR
jgi:hypothetical protein